MKLIKALVFTTLISFSTLLSAQSYTAFKVKVIGKGAPVLLFPGFACTGNVWDDVVEELSETNECHIFTLAGFGDVAPIETPWLPKIKTGLAEYISENKLEKATLIGHSLGGALSLWLATDENFDFSNIIVVDALTSIGALMMPNFKSENMMYDNPYNKQLLAMDDKAFDTMATNMAYGMTSNLEKRTVIKNWILQADKNTYVYGYTDLLKLDLRESVSQINSPVTILAATQPYGEESARNTYETQYKNLNGYTIKYAKESAHFIMYDQPEWLISMIKAEMK